MGSTPSAAESAMLGIIMAYFWGEARTQSVLGRWMWWRATVFGGALLRGLSHPPGEARAHEKGGSLCTVR